MPWHLVQVDQQHHQVAQVVVHQVDHLQMAVLEEALIQMLQVGLVS
jgi:hypothetical protein